MKIDRRYATAGLAAALVVAGAGVAGAVVVSDDDEGSGRSAAADVIGAQLPSGYVVTEVIDDDLKYQVMVASVSNAGERFTVTVFRQFDEAQVEDLPEAEVDGDTVWTGFDDPTLQAVYVQMDGDGVVLRVSHQGPLPVSVDDVTAIARTFGADPTIAAEANGATEPATG